MVIKCAWRHFYADSVNKLNQSNIPAVLARGESRLWPPRYRDTSSDADMWAMFEDAWNSTILKGFERLETLVNRWQIIHRQVVWFSEILKSPSHTFDFSIEPLLRHLLLKAIIVWNQSSLPAQARHWTWAITTWLIQSLITSPSK